MIQKPQLKKPFLPFEKKGNQFTSEPKIRLTLQESAPNPPDMELGEPINEISNFKTEYENTSESGISIWQIDIGNVGKNNSENPVAMRPQLADHTTKHLQPPENESQGDYNIPDSASYESSCDGVKLVPLCISSYDDIKLSYREYGRGRKAGRKSYAHNGDGDLVQCTVLKLLNCFAIPIIDSNDGKVKLCWCMDRIDLLKKVRASDGNVYIDILITDDLGTKKLRLPYNKLTESGIKGLARYNVRLFADYAMTMAIYLQKLADELPMEDASQQIGVVIDSVLKKLTFNGYTESGAFEVKSEYEDMNDYLFALNNLLEYSKPLQYLLSATMAAPVLTVLQKKYNYDIHSYCINIVGSSSTGKTIASRFCAAAWTNPTDDTIFSAMLATGNAALKRLAGRYGIPTFLDESTILGGIKADEYAYSVYEGREKRRLNSDCSEKASGTWSTIACMSSEQHFHNNSKNQNGGLAVRVHSIENLPWTASKEHAADIDDFIKNNYGVLGKRFTESLFKDEMIESLPELYTKAKVEMEEKCQDFRNDFTDRLCNTYALTYMTARMLVGLGVAIDTEGVARIMADHNAMVAGEQNLAINAFNAIISYVTRYSYKNGIRMYCNDQQLPVKVAIEQGLFAEILDRAGFKDVKVTVKELDKAGYIIRQVPAGLKSKLTINDTLCWCYQIDMSSFSEDAEIDISNESKAVPDIQYLTLPDDDEDFIEID